MASTIFGWQWPVLSTPTPLVKSRRVLPSTSWSQTPDADSTVTGEVLVLVIRNRVSAPMIACAFGPGIGVTILTPRDAGASFVEGGATGARALVSLIDLPREQRREGPKG